MIEITYFLQSDPEVPLSVRIPEALACAVSVRFRNLCHSRSTRRFFLKQIIGGVWRSEVDRRNITPVLDHFVRWLYTGKVIGLAAHQFSLFHFGERIQCPAFCNAALRALCNIKVDGTEDNQGDYFLQIELACFRNAWKSYWPTPSLKTYCDLDGDYNLWGHHALIRCLFAFAEYSSVNKSWLRRIMRDGGPLAQSEYVAYLNLAMQNPYRPAPWETPNFKQFLLDEDISRYPLRQPLFPPSPFTLLNN